MKKFFAAELALLFAATAFGQSYPSPTYNNVAINGTATIPHAAITGGTITGLSSPIPVASGGTNSAVASGTALDNITGFASTGFMSRTGAGAYSFTASTGSGSVVLAASPTIASPTVTGSFTATGLVTLADHATQAANTIIGNGTGSTASPTALAVPSCSAATNALAWTSGSGFSCNASINAATLGGATFAAPGPIGSTTPGTGAFTTLSASTSNPSLNFLATGTGAVARSYASKFGDIVSAVDFGADPTGAADSTTAINNAITAVSSAGGTVYLPNGTFKITASIVLPNTNASVNLIGNGLGTKIVNSSGTSFDMITWANPGAGNLIQTYAIVGNFQISQSGATGTSAEINTQYASSLTLQNILLAGIAATGDGIKITGNGATASHDIHIQGISGTSTTGNSVIHMTSTSNDIKVSNVIYEGQFLVNYGFLLDSGLGTVQIQDVHVSNFKTNVFSAGTATGPIQVTNAVFDSANADNTVLTGTTNSAFSNVRFMVGAATFSSLSLVNATGNQFTGCIFDAGGSPGPAAWGIRESGTSNGNHFSQTIFEGSFSSGIATLVGIDSTVSQSGMVGMLHGNGAITAGGTLYFANGAANSSEALAQIQAPYAGYVQKVLIASTNAPGASQTFTATVRKNSANTTLTATISGGSSFGATGNGFIAFNEGDQLDVQVVASGSATASNIRVTLVVGY
ncbi:beta strand repeat-containing protein [Burkholderia sp. BCC1998]|uniref:beta strand repeat-containing protein n=1 Tax=Burkholderia sp. BCC1998 TaxID=2817447 RepID=UPI002AB77993|nr:glycosyl hydrolase family 28-related protein [Burkholderia sp. BCC1998]